MIRALRDVVIIRRSSPDTVSAGGIQLAWDSDYKEDIGEVVSVGNGLKCKNCGHKAPVQVAPGDIVLFSTNGHQITTIQGEELIVLREPSIIAVLANKLGVLSGTKAAERKYMGVE
jgi:chaperonin GroES